jgi:hypothetical protein
MDENLTREERIRQYAWTWYQFRLQYGRPGTAENDWKKAEHCVEADDKAKMRDDEYHYKLRPSRMKC